MHLGRGTGDTRSWPWTDREGGQDMGVRVEWDGWEAADDGRHRPTMATIRLTLHIAKVASARIVKSQSQKGICANVHRLLGAVSLFLVSSSYFVQCSLLVNSRQSQPWKRLHVAQGICSG